MMTVPVTLGHWLSGAGKTTLVNHVLRAASGRRFAVIENEFGHLSIDSRLLEGAEERAVFELTEGCVCCTVRDDLVDILNELSRRASPPEHVVIEASGLADPVPVMQVFQSPQVRANYRLDGVVAVVNAEQLEADLNESEASREQLAYADLIVLNKTDRVPESGLAALEARLQRLNALARIVRAEHAQVPVEEALHLGGHDLESTLRQRASHRGDAAHHHHDDSISSVSVVADGDVDANVLDRWLSELVWRKDSQLLRMKGVLAVANQAQRFVFHGVRNVVDVEPGRPWGNEVRRNHVVFIGRNLDAVELRKGFLACLHRGAA